MSYLGSLSVLVFPAVPAAPLGQFPAKSRSEFRYKMLPRFKFAERNPAPPFLQTFLLSTPDYAA